MQDFFQHLLIRAGMPADYVDYITPWLFLIVVVVIGVIVNFVAKRLILKAVHFLITKTKNRWDDALQNRKVFSRGSHLAPALAIYLLALFNFSDLSHPLAILMIRGAQVYAVLVGFWVIEAFLSAVVDIYQSFEVARSRPIKGYMQAIKIVLLLCTGILAIATIVDRSPVIFFSGLGAVTAILLLVFKDAILGFVAGIQLAANNMVRTGDWISMPKMSADGDVIDVTLTTVKVQNWDKTITFIPIYRLIADSFTNWRGMSESGGRRIKRALYLDMTSVQFCDEAMLTRFEHFDLLKPYLKDKHSELSTYHQENDLVSDDPVNSRRLTNVGTFRAYVEAYLKHHPLVHQEMTLLVRQLAPGSQGLPIELYLFSNDQRWAVYENLQADIFDHLLAVLPQFGLRVYQQPSSHDLNRFFDESQSPSSPVANSDGSRA